MRAGVLLRLRIMVFVRQFTRDDRPCSQRPTPCPAWPSALGALRHLNRTTLNMLTVQAGVWIVLVIVCPSYCSRRPAANEAQTKIAVCFYFVGVRQHEGCWFSAGCWTLKSAVRGVLYNTKLPIS